MCLKKNLNAPRPSEYPPVRGKKCPCVSTFSHYTKRRGLTPPKIIDHTLAFVSRHITQSAICDYHTYICLILSIIRNFESVRWSAEQETIIGMTTKLPLEDKNQRQKKTKNGPIKFG